MLIGLMPISIKRLKRVNIARSADVRETPYPNEDLTLNC